jgi:hypothetical protein
LKIGADVKDEKKRERDWEKSIDREQTSLADIQNERHKEMEDSELDLNKTRRNNSQVSASRQRILPLPAQTASKTSSDGVIRSRTPLEWTWDRNVPRIHYRKVTCDIPHPDLIRIYASFCTDGVLVDGYLSMITWERSVLVKFLPILATIGKQPAKGISSRILSFYIYGLR